MIAQGRNIDACVTDNGQDVSFIGKFNFSTVNCHCTHKSASFLCFHINRIKVTVVLTGTALDTYVIVDVIWGFDLSADRTCRAVLCTFAAADTEFRINVEFTKCCTDFCTAFLVADMLLIFITEAFQCTDNRKRGTLAETAQSHALNHGRKFFQFVEIGHLALAIYDLLEDLEHTFGTLTARNAFTAALTLCKVHEESGNFNHTGILVHNYETARTHDRIERFDRIKVQRTVDLIFDQTSTGWSTDLYALGSAGRRCYAAGRIFCPRDRSDMENQLWYDKNLL